MNFCKTMQHNREHKWTTLKAIFWPRIHKDSKRFFQNLKLDWINSD